HPGFIITLFCAFCALLRPFFFSRRAVRLVHLLGHLWYSVPAHSSTARPRPTTNVHGHTVASGSTGSRPVPHRPPYSRCPASSCLPHRHMYTPPSASAPRVQSPESLVMIRVTPWTPVLIGFFGVNSASNRIRSMPFWSSVARTTCPGPVAQDRIGVGW